MAAPRYRRNSGGRFGTIEARRGSVFRENGLRIVPCQGARVRVVTNVQTRRNGSTTRLDAENIGNIYARPFFIRNPPRYCSRFRTVAPIIAARISTIAKMIAVFKVIDTFVVRRTIDGQFFAGILRRNVEAPRADCSLPN